MHYTVKQSNRRFEILDEYGQHYGVMDFNVWKPAKSETTTADGTTYTTESTGFWQTKKLISRNGLAYAEIQVKPTRGFIISFINGPTFRFRQKSFWSASEYTLIDNADSTVAHLTSSFKWKKFNFQYDIDINDALLDREWSKAMPLLLAYCIRLAGMQAGAASGALVPIFFR